MSADELPIPEDGAKRMLLMSHFSPQRPTITAQEFGRLLGVSAATVEVIADRLIRAGCLIRDSSGAYALAENDPQPITVRDERKVT